MQACGKLQVAKSNSSPESCLAQALDLTKPATDAPLTACKTNAATWLYSSYRISNVILAVPKTCHVSFRGVLVVETHPLGASGLSGSVDTGHPFSSSLPGPS